MEWHNEPPTWTVEDDTFEVTTGAKTDFWRKTLDGEIRDTGHFYFQRVEGDLTARVRFHGQYNSLYDHAGLMIRTSEAHWIKCGIEFVDGKFFVSAVVTNDLSDWSVAPLAENPKSFTLQLRRKKSTVEVRYGSDEGDLILLRQAYFPPFDPVQIGVMCASPKGEGFPVTFHGFSIEKHQETEEK